MPTATCTAASTTPRRHGSRPNPDSAPNRLVHALTKILAYKTPLRVLPVVDEFLRDMAPYEPPERALYYRNVKKAIEDKKFQQEVERDESLNFLLRDTISLTMMGGSGQTNVIPPEAWANLDLRILPGGDPKAVVEALRRVVNDPDVTIEPIETEFRVANYSGTDNALFAAIREASAKIRTGPPVDDEEDYALATWAGVLPLRTVTGAPLPDERMPAQIAVPESVRSYARRGAGAQRVASSAGAEVSSSAVRGSQTRCRRCKSLRNQAGQGQASPVRQSRKVHSMHPNQCTMLIAIAGVIELLVFLPAGNTRMPAITPTLLVKLYSIAGASPKA